MEAGSTGFFAKKADVTEFLNSWLDKYKKSGGASGASGSGSCNDRTTETRQSVLNREQQKVLELPKRNRYHMQKK